MASMRWKKQVNVSRVISKIVVTVLALYVGGKILTAVGESLGQANESPFWTGLSFLGFTETGGVTGTAIFGVIGLIAAASIVMEFVEISF